MNYIGSKMKLCNEFLPQTIYGTCGKDLSNKIFCDLFAGTGIVGRTFKTCVRKVIANDLEYYSYVLNRNYIGNHVEMPNKQDYIDSLNNIPDSEGFIYDNYCLGGSGTRQYFSDENGKRIDAIRNKIEELRTVNKISDNMYFYLLCSLLECADKVANTASVYGAFLKRLKKSAQKPMVLTGAEYSINDNEHEVYQEDANALIKRIEGDILYLDPPYNERQYGANYHLLNTIAIYKPFAPKGKTGLRQYTKSKYCSKSTVLEEFEDIVKNARFKYVFLSYNNEGLMSIDDIKGVMKKYGRYDMAETEYSRFKADSNRRNIANSTHEYIHILEKN